MEARQKRWRRWEAEAKARRERALQAQVQKQEIDDNVSRSSFSHLRKFLRVTVDYPSFK